MKTFKIALGQGERLLDGVVRSGIALAHDCGGALACATCRVAVLEGLESLRARRGGCQRSGSE